jgi:serine protease Do
VCAALIVLLLLLITIHVWFSGGNGSQGSHPSPPSPPSPEQIAARLRQSTVGLQGSFKVYGWIVDDDYAWSGSGVIISRDHDHYTILSNAHVVGIDEISGAKWFMDPRILAYKLEVRMPDQQKAPAKAVFVNAAEKDFALVYVDASVGNYPPLPLTTNNPVVGAQVFAMGDPLGLQDTFTSGMVSAYRGYTSPLDARYDILQHTAAISHGNSGGPLVDNYCNLIGINTLNVTDGTAQNLNFAITAKSISQSDQQWISFPLTPPNIGTFVVNLKKGQYKR